MHISLSTVTQFFKSTLLVLQEIEAFETQISASIPLAPVITNPASSSVSLAPVATNPSTINQDDAGTDPHAATA